MSTDSRSLRTLGCALTLLAAALVGASSPARAQEEDGSGAPWLQVEVLVFRQLDSSLASLGTVYSQILLVGSTEVDSDRAERLQADIDGEVQGLQDVVASINEVYDYKTLGPGK